MSDTEGNEDSAAIYISGNKGKPEYGDGKKKHNDKTSETEGNEDSDTAIYIPGKKTGDSKKGQISDKDNSRNIESEGILFIPGNKKLDNKFKSSETKSDDKVNNDIGTTKSKTKANVINHEGKISNVQETVVTSWPLGIITYYFDVTSIDNILANRIRESMEIIEGASCVQFKQVTVKPEDNQYWIHITNSAKDRGCVHRGMHQSTGEIRMTLGLDCLKRRDILHALLHAMGFADEVSHPYRDQYIHIMWENIQPKYQDLFSIAGPGENNLHVEYDPMSIMHFHERAFSKNGRATIVPVMPGLRILPSDKLSQLDKMKLRLAFSHECNRRSVDHLVDACKVVLQDKVGKNIKEIDNKGSKKSEVVGNKKEGKEKKEKEHEKHVLVNSTESKENKERKEYEESKKSEDDNVKKTHTEKRGKSKERHESKENKEKSNEKSDSKLDKKEKENLSESVESITTPEESGQKIYTDRVFLRQSKKSHVEGKKAKDLDKHFLMRPLPAKNKSNKHKNYKEQSNKSRAKDKQANYNKPLFHILPADKNVISSHNNNIDSIFLIHSGQFNKSRVEGKQDNMEKLFSAPKNKTRDEEYNTDRLLLNLGQIHKSHYETNLKQTKKTFLKHQNFEENAET